MARALRVFNGRGYCVKKAGDPIWDQVPHNGSAKIYAAAYSRADLRRLIEEYCGTMPSDNELKTYWSEAWGANMQGVAVERGLWFKYGHGPELPTRIY